MEVESRFSDPCIAISGMAKAATFPFFILLICYNLNTVFQNSLLVKYADDFCLLHYLMSDGDDRFSENFSDIKAWASVYGFVINW